jgi:hypothetical protein
MGDAHLTPQPDHRHQTRRVVLPSGKTIEVVYFESPLWPRPQPSEPGLPTEDLHRCGSCGGELVHPVTGEEAGPAHWQVTLRCPNCEWSATGVFEQEAVERFDEELDRGTDALVRDLKRLLRANMEEEIERFVRALRDDHVLPFDF